MEFLPKNTPAHLFYPDRLVSDIKAFLQPFAYLQDRAQIYFSAKTCALPHLLHTMAEAGLGLELLSGLDLALVEAWFGSKKPKLIVGDNQFTAQNLRHLFYQIKPEIVYFDSLEQLQLAAAVLRQGKTTTELGLRIHVPGSHFGFRVDVETCKFIENNLALPISALQVHSNQSCSSRDSAFAKFQSLGRILLEAKSTLESCTSNKITSFNFGGGIDSPHIHRVADENLAAYHTKNVNVFDNLQPKDSISAIADSICRAIAQTIEGTTLRAILEPGRLLATRALSTVLSVKATKNSLYPGHQILIVDGNFAQLDGLHSAIHPIYAIDNNRKKIPTYIYSFLPQNTSWLAQGLFFEECHTNEKIVVAHTGAYFLARETSFCSTKPAVWHAHTGALLRRQETNIDISERDILSPSNNYRQVQIRHSEANH